MFIGLIAQGNASREFNGYLDKEASKRKTIENVFVKGDKAFLTGTFYITSGSLLFFAVNAHHLLWDYR